MKPRIKLKLKLKPQPITALPKIQTKTYDTNKQQYVDVTPDPHTLALILSRIR